MPESSEKENMLSKRLNKVLEMRFENDQDTLEALKELSTFYTENTLQARRNLRSQIEKRSLAINENFLSEFRKVKESLDSVYEDISAMNREVQDMFARLQNTKLQTKALIEQTNSYQKENDKIEMQQQIVKAFMDKFQLNSVDIEALHGKTRDSPVTKEIFDALDKVQEIHSNCKYLMQSGHQSLALDIMEKMTLHQESSLERLYRWTQSHCRNIDTSDYTTLLMSAMNKLQERPVLFKYVIDEYCTSRRAFLVGEFIDALTKGGSTSNPAPIDLKAHDPQIYVTDMLVWLHKWIPIEKENLFLLVKMCNQIDISEQLAEALRSITEGICHPLKVRVVKILTVPAPATTLYSVTNQIRYYRKQIGKTVSGGLLDSTLLDLQEQSEKSFLTALQHQVTVALVRVETPPRDLSPTPSINHLLAVLRDVLSTASMSEGRETDMGKIASCVIDPMLRAVNEQAVKLSPIDMAVYMLNCMYSMYTCLSLYEFMDERLERLQAQSDAQIDTLTSEQASSLVANLNLGPIYTILQDQGKAPLSTIPGMEPSNLRNFLTRLDSLSTMPDMILLPQITLLLSSKHRNQVQQRAFDVLLVIYKQLYEGVHNPDNLYENPESILSRTPEEVSKMFAPKF